MVCILREQVQGAYASPRPWLCVAAYLPWLLGPLLVAWRLAGEPVFVAHVKTE